MAAGAGVEVVVVKESIASLAVGGAAGASGDRDAERSAQGAAAREPAALRSAGSSSRSPCDLRARRLLAVACGGGALVVALLTHLPCFLTSPVLHVACWDALPPGCRRSS